MTLRDRFELRLDWREFAGQSGSGVARPLTSDTGTFWFFDAQNVEVVVKILDGRPINGHFWLYYGSLSNVEYTLYAKDTVTGFERELHNPLGHFGSLGRVDAFPAPDAVQVPGIGGSSFGLDTKPLFPLPGPWIDVPVLDSVESTSPQVAPLPDGRWFVVWGEGRGSFPSGTEHGRDGSLGSVVALVASPTLDALGPPSVVPQITDGHQSRPSAAVDADLETVLVTWRTGTETPHRLGARLLSLDGAALGPESELEEPCRVSVTGVDDGIALRALDSHAEATALPGGGWLVSLAAPAGAAALRLDDAGELSSALCFASSGSERGVLRVATPAVVENADEGEEADGESQILVAWTEVPADASATQERASSWIQRLAADSEGGLAYVGPPIEVDAEPFVSLEPDPEDPTRTLVVGSGRGHTVFTARPEDESLDVERGGDFLAIGPPRAIERIGPDRWILHLVDTTSATSAFMILDRDLQPLTPGFVRSELDLDTDLAYSPAGTVATRREQITLVAPDAFVDTPLAGRFALELDWMDSHTVGGRARQINLSADTASFWFFSPQNREVVVKVLDGRPINGHFWVYYASLTDLTFTLTVTDLETGRQAIYTNPLGRQASRGDVTALPAPIDP